jgi:hypothetical protein
VRGLAALGLVTVLGVPAVSVDAPTAAAALPLVTGCSYHLGPIATQGAAGTLYYLIAVEPASPVQSCTTNVTFTAAITPTAVGSSYTNILNNPLHATQSVTFVPGRLPPLLLVGWSGLHCADPAVPGNLTVGAGGGTESVPVSPTTCGGSSPSFLLSGTAPTYSTVGIAPTTTGHGYRLLDQSGYVLGEGDAASLGDLAAPTAPAAAIAADPASGGVWVATEDGGIYSYGGAVFHGSLGGLHLNAPIVGMAATHDGGGYWLVAADGGIFSFGDATFHGSLGSLHLNAPIVGIAATHDGGGYWLVAEDGGVFSFGDATFEGSLGSLLLNAPIVGMASDPAGGYWLVGSDGGIFSFGGAAFHGSTGGMTLNAPVSAMAATTDGGGYWLVGSDGGVFTFGDAGFYGAQPLAF